LTKSIPTIRGAFLPFDDNNFVLVELIAGRGAAVIGQGFLLPTLVRLAFLLKSSMISGIISLTNSYLAVRVAVVQVLDGSSWTSRVLGLEDVDQIPILLPLEGWMGVPAIKKAQTRRVRRHAILWMFLNRIIYRYRFET
jgi:hypothetical protein